MLPFAVVEFKHTRTVGIICTDWLSEDEDQCYYPRVSDGKNIKKFLTEHAVPTPSWKIYAVKVLRKTDDIAKAEKKLTKSLETSNLDTTDVESQIVSHAVGKSARKRCVPTRLLSSESGDSDSEPSSRCRTAVAESDAEEQPPPDPFSRPSQERTPARSRPVGHNATPGTSAAGASPLPTESTDLPVVVQLLKRCLMGLEDIKETQRVHGKMLQASMRRMTEDQSVNFPDTASFPLQSLDEFDAMERKLMDPAFASGLGCYLGDIGGKNLDETVRRIMKFVFKNETAMKFNVSGINGKRGFGGTALFEAVNVAVKKNALTNSNTKKDVERALGKWFAGCRDRDGNRARRASRNNVVQETDATDVSQTD